jgi:hypothetical protein
MFRKLQGTDSYVGEFVGDATRLGFDFGLYSNPLPDPKDPRHVVSFEVINGRPGKLVVPRSPGHGTTGVYFGDLPGGNKLEVSGTDIIPSQQDVVVRILRTIQAKDFKPIP